MDRLMVGVASGVAVALAAPIIAIIGLSSWGEGNCKDEIRELKGIRGAVAADLTILHSAPLETVAVCDSGDRPYLSTHLKPSIRPEQAMRLLENKGWRVVKTYRWPDGTVWSWELQKNYQVKSAYLSIDRVKVTGAVSISVNLL
jgi:hypothetical protein